MPKIGMECFVYHKLPFKETMRKIGRKLITTPNKLFTKKENLGHLPDW